jgi:hypothetical protein
LGEDMDISIQTPSFPFTGSLPTTANSMVFFVPSAAVVSYWAPAPTVGFRSPLGIEGPRPIICAFADAARSIKQQIPVAARLKFLIIPPFSIRAFFSNRPSRPVPSSGGAPPKF